ncbi:hybrid sensor histidine kinase/response regulator transcription factor [Parapedobacter tibetensis]|uniref:hybrid sensor histidine kinase/response regulator transcription factor n=1 Tax=Parapedobacter tibetensis TaxID=2972951 RepID=UPI00214DAF42|nr:two-component regulator propeller domain-containing protein [Parapedobacter tibetensis]
MTGKVLPILLWFAISTCHAFSGEKIQATYLGIEHGLSNNYVNCIYQDRHGFMWIGTFDGLNRYDGYEFRAYKHILDDETSLPDNGVSAIIEDARQRIWVATKRGAAILGENGSTFRRLRITSANREHQPLRSAINGFAIDASGQLFAGSERVGLLAISDGQDGVPVGHSIPLMQGYHKKHSYSVHGIAVDEDGKLWLFVQHVGLCYYDSQHHSVRIASHNLREATTLCTTPDGMVWIGSDKGLFRYDPTTEQYRRYSRQDGLSSNSVSALYLGKDNRLWVCTDGGGINVLDGASGAIQHIRSNDEGGILTSNAVFAVYEDAQSRQWIGTLRGGINIIDPNKRNFERIQYPVPNGMVSAKNFVLSLAEDGDQSVWIGTDGGGLINWDRKTNRFKRFGAEDAANGSLSSNYVTSVLRDRKNNIWVGTYGGGINRWDSRSQSFIRYACKENNARDENPYIWQLYEDSKGRIWATTLKGGHVFLLNAQSGRFEPFDMDVSSVLSLLEDGSDVLWFGNYGELVRVDMASRSKHRYPVDHPIRFIHKGKDNVLWLGTNGGGLLEFDIVTETFRRYTESDGLPSNTLLKLLEDSKGNFWISTHHGLSKFHPAAGTFQNFFESDGLQSNQFGYNAALRLRSGEFVFGGIRGFNIFHPDGVRLESVAPKMVLTDLHINNQPFDRTNENGESLLTIKKLVIPYHQAVLTFGFAALEFSFPDKIRYAYFLEGWDNDWNYVNGERTARYSRLHEGKYTLRIKSTDANGLWTGLERTMAIEVLPPWWRTPWAYGLYLCLALAAVAAYVHYDRRQMKLKHHLELAEVTVEKERELNEKKIAFFTHISHEFRAPLTLIVNPIKDMLYDSKNKMTDPEELTNIYRNSRRLLSLVDKLLLFRKADSGMDELRLSRLDIVNLCHEVFLCFKQHASSRQLDYRFSCDADHIEVLGDREKLEICLFNLISNAIKFTPEQGSVEVSLARAGDGIDITVTDTGFGIPPHVGDALFNSFHRDYTSNGEAVEGFGIGLFLVKTFAEAHSGSVSYTSVAGEGTCFTLHLLEGRNHLDSHLVFEDIGEHSVFLDELLPEAPIGEEAARLPIAKKELNQVSKVISDRLVMLVVDDHEQIRQYIYRLFENDFTVYEADNGHDAFELVKTHEPDIVISDVVMNGMTGIDLCSSIKQDPLYSHIPVILLTASSSTDVKLKGIEGGADDYMTKPFDNELLIARVSSIIKSRNRLQQFFYNEITLQSNDHKIPVEYSEFLKKCIKLIELQLNNPDFNVSALADELDMSRPNLYKRIKSISGKSASEFIRFIRLRKVAQLLISTNQNISEAAFAAGFNDIKYFREQFSKLFGMNPSEYKRKYAATLRKNHTIKKPVK